MNADAKEVSVLRIAATGMRRVCVLQLVVVSGALAQAGPQTPEDLRGRPVVVFVHGRAQEYKTAAEIERVWYEAFDGGIQKLGAQDDVRGIRLAAKDRRLVHYEYIYEKDFHPICRNRFAKVVRIDGQDLYAYINDVDALTAQVRGALGAASNSIAFYNPARQFAFDKTADYSGFVSAAPKLEVLSAKVNRLQWHVLTVADSARDAGRMDQEKLYREFGLALGRQADSMSVLASELGHIRLATKRVNVSEGVKYLLPDSAPDVITRAARGVEWLPAPRAMVGATYVDESLFSYWDGVGVAAPASWTGNTDEFKHWLATAVVQLGLGTWALQFFEDVRQYIGEWDYQCATNEVLSQAISSAMRQERPVIVVAHSLGSLITYRLLQASDVAFAPPKSATRVRNFIALGSQLGIKEVMTSLTGLKKPPFPYPQGIDAWTILLGENDPIAPGVPPGSIQIPAGKSLTVRSIVTRPGNQHDIVGYLKNVDAARVIMVAWCGAFAPSAMRTRPPECSKLLADDARRRK